MLNEDHILFVVEKSILADARVSNTLDRDNLYDSTETLVDALQHNGIYASLRYVASSREIHHLISEIKPSVVVFESAWIQPCHLELLKACHNNVRFIVRNSVEIPYLINDPQRAGWICDYLKMDIEIGCTSEFIAKDLWPILDNLNKPRTLASILPTIYPNVDSHETHVKDIPLDELNVASFGPTTSFENYFGQFMAALNYANKKSLRLVFHVNVQDNTAQAVGLVRNLRGAISHLTNCELVVHKIDNREQLYELLRTKIDLVMQTSFGQTCELIVADAINCSVPVMTGTDISWLSARYHFSPTHLSVMSNEIGVLFTHGTGHLRSFVDKQRNSLLRYNEFSIAEWTNRFSSTALAA